MPNSDGRHRQVILATHASIKPTKNMDFCRPACMVAAVPVVGQEPRTCSKASARLATSAFDKSLSWELRLGNGEENDRTVIPFTVSAAENRYCPNKLEDMKHADRDQNTSESQRRYRESRFGMQQPAGTRERLPLTKFNPPMTRHRC